MTKKRKNPAPKSKKTAPKKGDKVTPSGKKAPSSPSKDRDPRLPAPGTVLQRTWHKKVYEIAVGDHDFACRGTTYRSLSALARAVTGAKSINGFLWAGLVDRPTAAKASGGEANAS